MKESTRDLTQGTKDVTQDTRGVSQNKRDLSQNTRDFDAWLAEFKSNIASFDYYVDFDKVRENAEKWRPELYLMNSLLGSKDIEHDFLSLYEKYPQILHAIPILLAMRKQELPVLEVDAVTTYHFGNGKRNSPQDYCEFLRLTGLFELMETHSISNLFDYVIGVEVGLDSNGRKNRVGHLMENLVEGYLMSAGLTRKQSDGKSKLVGDPHELGVYYKELYSSQAQRFWGIDLSSITNNGTVEKRFDFVVKTNGGLFGIETNFYSGGGSKLQETARSYKEMAEESKDIEGFSFVWVTDGQGWKSARNNLRETFEVMDTIYNLSDLGRGAFKELFKSV